MLDASNTTEIERLPGESVTDFWARKFKANAARDALVAEMKAQCFAANIFAQYEHHSNGLDAFTCSKTAWFNAGKSMRSAHLAKMNGWFPEARKHVATAMRWRAAAKSGGMIQSCDAFDNGVHHVRVGAA